MSFLSPTAVSSLLLTPLLENVLILSQWLPSLFTCKWCGKHQLAATPACNKLNFSFASSSLHVQSPGPTVTVSSRQLANTSCFASSSLHVQSPGPTVTVSSRQLANTSCFASSSLHVQSPGPTVTVSSRQQLNTSCLHFSIHTHVHSQFCKNIFIQLVFSATQRPLSWC